MRPAIELQDIGKQFRTWRSRPAHNTLRDAIAAAANGLVRGAHARRNGDDSFWALRGITCDVSPGEAVGIIGPNGAGKSTLLKILAEVMKPSEGVGQVRGRVGSLLEVGTGFHSELTGRENVFLSGAILGMPRAEIARKFDQIVEFAEVEPFVETPVKHYSSGMYLRLAFAVAAHLDPDILIVDEVLAVGDERFQRKCIAKMEEVSRHAGRTILFVSHNLAAVQKLCTRCLLLEQGRLTDDATPREVIGRYLGSLGGSTSVARQALDVSRVPRKGSAVARFVSLEYRSDEPAVAYQPYSDGPLHVRLQIIADRDVSVTGLAVNLSDAAGTMLVNADAFELGQRLELLPGESSVMVRIRSLHLKPGSYTVGLWLEGDTGELFDYVGRAATVQVLAAPGPALIRRPVNGSVTCEFDMNVEPRGSHA